MPPEDLTDLKPSELADRLAAAGVPIPDGNKNSKTWRAMAVALLGQAQSTPTQGGSVVKVRVPRRIIRRIGGRRVRIGPGIHRMRRRDITRLGLIIGQDVEIPRLRNPRKP